jgi:hypothetical protein
VRHLQGNPHLLYYRNKKNQTSLVEEVLPGYQLCTGQCQTRGDHGKQATKRVSTVKLPNGQQTETGKETLKELFRVHFPNSKMIDDSYDNGQGQQNLGICKRITNRGDWNLARRMINQSKIRWALGTFKPFKSAGTDGIVPVLFKQGAEHVRSSPVPDI